MLSQNDVKHIQRWIEKNSFRARLASSVAVVFLLIWLFFGFFVPWLLSPGPDWRERAAHLGDMFGIVNSLFSGLALFGVVAALFLQMKEVRSNERSQREQLEIAQKTARIQAFTFLAQLQYTLMEDAPDEFDHIFKSKAGYCIDRALDLMNDLGEKFPNPPDLGIKADFYSDVDYARMALERIFNWFRENHRRVKEDAAPDNAAAVDVCRELGQKLDAWFSAYKDVERGRSRLWDVKTRAEQLCDNHLTNPAQAGMSFLRAETLTWMKYWDEYARLPAVFAAAYDDFRRQHTEDEMTPNDVTTVFGPQVIELSAHSLPPRTA